VRILATIARDRLQVMLVFLVLLAVFAMFVSPLLELPESALRAARRAAVMLCALLLLAQTIVRMLRRPRAAVAIEAGAAEPLPPELSAQGSTALLSSVILLC
jgi:ABC-type enterobactin transport system permease subunit